MNKAVFLDRDGVINEERDHLKTVEELRVFPGVADSIKTLRERGYLVVIATNQGGIAKGLFTERTLKNIHGVLEARLAKDGATLDGIYYCPHHEEGIVAEYTKACDWRKPGTGMFRQAAKDLKIDFVKSFFVGDSTSDILAGQRVGMKTILVRTGRAGTDGRHDVKPDFIADDLPMALKYIP